MAKKINVYWGKIKEGYGNFGDELNHYIIKKLSGYEVRRIIIPSTGFDYIYKSLSYIYNRVVPLRDYPKLIKQFFIRDIIVAIGSVLSVPNNEKAKIWGSGIIKQNEKINKAQFFAVRGKYTQKRLAELGFDPPQTIGDPALLLPIIYKPHTIKKYKLGIIPHYVHLNEIKKNNFDSENILIIDVLKEPEQIINQICSCEKTISSSLHGIIVSHAYKVPSLWCKLGKEKLAGDNVKFIDYFSSVNIDPYECFRVSLDEKLINQMNFLFKKNSNKSQINTDINYIQKELIEHAPFYINKSALKY